MSTMAGFKCPCFQPEILGRSRLAALTLMAGWHGRAELCASAFNINASKQGPNNNKLQRFGLGWKHGESWWQTDVILDRLLFGYMAAVHYSRLRHEM